MWVGLVGAFDRKRERDLKGKQIWEKRTTLENKNDPSHQSLKILLHSFIPQPRTHKKWQFICLSSLWSFEVLCEEQRKCTIYDMSCLLPEKSDHCLPLSLWPSEMLLNFAEIVGFVKVVTLISLRGYMDLSKMFYVFLALCRTKPSRSWF